MSTCLDLSSLHMRCCTIDKMDAVQEGNQVTEIEKMDRPTIQIPVSRVYFSYRVCNPKIDICMF